jgi:ADP-ribose pyrophosphatase YjhB (NUDIX family)
MGSDALRKSLLTELINYQPDDADELAFKSRFIALVEHFENAASRDLLHGHLTGSAWIVNRDMSHALMTHHAKLDKWLQLGGHADGDFNIKNVALREAREESGLNSVRILQPSIFDIDIHEIPARGNEPAHDHFDIRYLIWADKSETVVKNHESKEISWIPLNQLDQLTANNRSIIRMSEKTLTIKGKVPPLWYID